MNYSAGREFRIWSYSVSHSTLILRSYLFEEVGTDIVNDTIDIEFWAVEYIELPATIDGLVLSLSNDFPSRLQKYLKYDLKTFQLATKSQSYYIIAAGCSIGKSSWSHDIGRFQNLKLNYPEVIAIL